MGKTELNTLCSPVSSRSFGRRSICRNRSYDFFWTSIRLGIGIEVLMREKSTRSRVAPVARFSIFTPTADGLATHFAEQTAKNKKPPPSPLLGSRTRKHYDPDHGPKAFRERSEPAGHLTAGIGRPWPHTPGPAKNAHGKALCTSQKTAHQIRRM